MDAIPQTPASTPDLGSSLTSLPTTEETSIYGLPNPFRVKAKGKGLKSGSTNQPCFFTLDARKAGYGDFDILVRGPSQAEIIYHDQDDDTLYTVEYRVTLPGDYSIEIRYDNRHIPGSPFDAKITNIEGNDANNNNIFNSNNKSSSEVCNKKPYVNGEIENNAKNQINSFVEKPKAMKNGLQGYVTSPTGDIFTASLARKPDGTFAVKFPRNEPGTYLVNIVNSTSGKCISGCPFKVRVSSQSVEEPKVYGSGLEHCLVGETGMFTVKGTQDFTFTDLAIAFEGNYLSSIKIFKNFYDSVDFLYVPNRPGSYRIHINYRGKQTSGSPYRFIVKSRKKSRELFETFEPGSLHLLIWIGVDLPSTVNTEVINPDGICLPHSFASRDKNVFEIRFFPKDNGMHTVKIETDQTSGTSENFCIDVQNVIKDAAMFPVVNKSSDREIQINKPGKIIIDIPTGMPKHLTVQFNGPGQVDSQRIEGLMKQIQMHYKAKIPGNYVASMSYDGIPVKGSPFQISVVDENGNRTSGPPDATEFCSCYGKGLKDAKSGEMSNFIVDACNAGQGSLMVGFDDPDVSATEIVSKHMGNCVYDVQYCIEKNGIYELTVMWGGKHVPGSPFKVNVR